MSSSDVAPVRPGEDLDWARLEKYLRSELPDLDGPFSVLQFPRGAANLTYQVTFGAQRLVVRRPPFGALGAGAHDMRREYRVLSQLWESYPRAPRALLYTDNPEVLGAEFFVSEYRAGVVVSDAVPESMSRFADVGRRIGFAVIDALADLHNVLPQECGLAGLGRPDGYLERQLAGWQRRWEAVDAQSDSRELSSMIREVGRRLRQHMPRSQRVGIVHNDYKVDNCQFAEGDPDIVVSVFDWDMATTGDTLVDLGTLLNYWPDDSVAPDSDAAFVAVPGSRNLGLPNRVEVVERYARRSTFDLSDIEWYEAFGCWKTAVILQQLYARFVRRETTDPRMGLRGKAIPPLTRRALDLLPA